MPDRTPANSSNLMTRLPCPRLWHLRRLFAAAALFAAGVAGCAQPSPPARENVRPVYGANGRLERLEQDRNGDGRVDTWLEMDGSRAVRAEVDENGDGRPDRWEYYAPASPSGGPAVIVERIDRATRFDGRILRRQYYEQGKLARVEEDTDADGRIDKWETYRQGVLERIDLDTEGLGRPNRRLVYRDGQLLRMEDIAQ